MIWKFPPRPLIISIGATYLKLLQKTWRNIFKTESICKLFNMSRSDCIDGQIKLGTFTQCETHLHALDMIKADKREKSGRFAKTSNLRKYCNRLINITTPRFLEFMTRLVCSENGLHASIASYRADLFTSTSLSKDFDNSSCAQKFIMEISDKTKGNDLALECLSNILNPYVIFRLD